MDKKLRNKLFLAILFSIGFMFFLLARIEWKHFAIIADRLEMKYLIAAFGVFSAGNLVRTSRFIWLDHTGNKLVHWWNTNAFYNFMTATLPGGTGEAATAYVLKRFSLLNMLGAFRILLISRVMDVTSLSFLFFMAAVRISSATPYRDTAIWLTGFLFFATLIALIPASERMILRLLQGLPGDISFINKLCERLNELLEIAKERQSAGYYAVTLTQSVVAIIGGIASLYLLLQAFGVDFTLIQSAYCYGVYAVFQIIPIQGIAGIGTQAAWFALALNAAGYKALDAIALGFVLHGTFYVFITILGLSALVVCFLNRTAD